MTNNVIKKVYKNGVEYQIYGSAGAEGAGDVTGPSSATSGHLAVFDGTTGKTIKDGGAVPTGVPSGGSDGQFLGKSSGNLTWTNAPVTSVNGSTGAVTGLQTTSNLKTSLSDNSDSYYPSQKAVKTAVDGKQDTLESGTNIKTINGNSILGSGDLTVGGITKIFDVAALNVANLQAAVDWYNNGGMPIVKYSSQIYHLQGASSSGMHFVQTLADKETGSTESAGFLTRFYGFAITLSSGTATAVTQKSFAVYVGTSAPTLTGIGDRITLVI